MPRPLRWILGPWWSRRAAAGGGGAADPFERLAPRGQMAVANVPNQEVVKRHRLQPNCSPAPVARRGSFGVSAPGKRGFKRSPIEARRRVKWRCCAISDTPHRTGSPEKFGSSQNAVAGWPLVEARQPGQRRLLGGGRFPR